jgi:hypothetical protein
VIAIDDNGGHPKKQPSPWDFTESRIMFDDIDSIKKNNDL